MALTDIHFQQGEGRAMIVEIPTIVYSGYVSDILIENSSGKYLVLEAPLGTGSGGGNIFIMSE